MTTAGTRVLKMHTDAVRGVLRDELPAFLERELPAADLVQHLAEAVVTASDGGTKTYYCAGVRLPDGHALIYGPYATRAAAEKALASGALVSQPGATGGVWPLLTAPAASRTPKKKKR